MCFHYSLILEKSEIAIQLSVNEKDLNFDWQPVYHADAFADEKMPIVFKNNSEIKVEMAHWGLLPQWLKTEEEAKKFAANTYNAKCETIHEKPSFKPSILKNRCAILASGFFENMDVNKVKYPHYITLKNENYFAFAGIYTDWINKNTGEMYKTFSIITKSANDIMSKIHNTKLRMPVCIKPNEIDDWLNNALVEQQNKFFATNNPEFEFITISKNFNKRLFNKYDPKNIEPVEYPELVFCY